MEDKPVYAYLGPEGTFSHMATLEFAQRPGGEYAMQPCATIEDVFEAVDRGRAMFGVVPIENALEGGVTSTLDAFAFDTTAQIVDEAVIDIHHCLIAAQGVQLEDITRLVSHPQPLGQCRRFIQKNLSRAQVVRGPSTAESVREAVGTPGTAGIGTRLAAQIYGGQVLADSIEDHYENQTRFVLVSQRPPVRRHTDHDKTSLALFMKHDASGVLLMILSEFAFAGINLTYIQSRPLKRALGEYMFFVDLEGNMDDPAVRTALDCLRLKLREVKVLGSYPAAPASK